jgi:hypothetical protein
VGISLLVFLPIAAPFTAKRATGKCLKIRVHSKIPKSALLELTAETAARYLENLKERNVAPSTHALERLTELEEPMPALPTEADRILETLDRIGSPATMAMAGPRYFGFVIGGSLPGAPGGELVGRRVGPMPRPVRGLTDRYRSGKRFRLFGYWTC